MQERRGAFGMGGGGENRPLVVLQHGEPRSDIGSMIVASLGREAEIGGEKGAAKLSDQLFCGIALVAPALAAELPVEAGGMTSRVTAFVREGGVIAFGVPKGFKGRHLHIIGTDRVIGAVAALPNIEAGCGKNASARAMRATGSRVGAAGAV